MVESKSLNKSQG